MVAAAVVGAGVVSAGASAYSSRRASRSQQQSNDAAIDAQMYQFEQVQELLQPYVQTGQTALTYQQELLGIGGPKSHARAIAGIENGAQFQTALRQGENAILQNASATGGLRGGNTQNALMQFRPQLLNQTINDRLAQLGGISSMGLGAATGTGQFGQASANNISQLLQQNGAAQAGNYMAQGNAVAGLANSALGAYGIYAGQQAGINQPTGGKF